MRQADVDFVVRTDLAIEESTSTVTKTTEIR